MNKIIVLVLLVTMFISCKENTKKSEQIKKEESTPVAYALNGEPYYEPIRSAESQQRLDTNLEKARNSFNSDSSEMNYIWFGRRTAYLSRYPEAISIFTQGIESYPNSYRLYRHRGHRYISIREFDKAINDFKQALELMPKDSIEIEPDGIPNKLNQPLSSTQFNVWYHLGLAYYLNGEFDLAADAYEQCMETSVNNDLKVATTDWYFMTLQRLGQLQKADSLLSLISEDMEIIENDSYFKRLQMYQQKLTPDSVLNVDSSSDDYQLSLATQGYGVGNYYLMQGDTTKAIQIFNKVLEGEYWSAFGYIAAEAEMERMNKMQ